MLNNENNIVKFQQPKIIENIFFVNTNNNKYIISKYIPNYNINFFKKIIPNKDILEKLKEKLENYSLNIKDDNNIIGEISNNINNKIRILDNNDIINLFYNCHKLKMDKNIFYRIIIFFYFENIFFNNDEEKLKNLICDISNKYYNNSLIKTYFNKNNINFSELINLLIIIYIRLIKKKNGDDNNFDSVFDYFIKAYNNYNNFDLGLIL